MKKINQFAILVLLTIISLSISNKSYAHCEIPCGIYEDTLRIKLIQEHIVTIEKSMKMIIELSDEETPNYNQLVRWVNNKEDHANKLQDIVTQYFLNQRIKPINEQNTEQYNKYIKQLTLLHELLVYSMKAKQTTDLTYIEKLNQTINNFEESYFHKHEH
ncbi:MAG: superoxide dismutase [Ni] [Bacteroidales bacterium]|jgi:nickel superoxide dismutase|nr:superoxide dismutase [Ni] [Bacteroidales bacterium]